MAWFMRRCGMSANETTLHPSRNLKVNHYRSKCSLQLRALAQPEQQARNGPKYDL